MKSYRKAQCCGNCRYSIYQDMYPYPLLCMKIKTKTMKKINYDYICDIYEEGE